MEEGGGGGGREGRRGEWKREGEGVEGKAGGGRGGSNKNKMQRVIVGSVLKTSFTTTEARQHSQQLSSLPTLPSQEKLDSGP